MERRVFLFIRIFGLMFFGLIFVTSCSNEKSAKAKPNIAVPVTVSTAIQKTIPVQLRAIGNVEAYSKVSVKPKVGGEITHVHFTEGQDVKKGDLLFTIDPRPFEAALKQAEANLERDTAQLKNAQIEANRYKVLIEKGVVARQQYERISTNADVLEATVLADKAAVENAKIQLGYCFIRSPIDGRTGGVLVQRGNIVKAEDVDLVVIHQIKPIYVTFSVPEQNLLEIQKYMAMGKLKVEAIIPKDEDHREEGIITFVDNAVDSRTGTIRLKGTFTNKGMRLWPGQFVNTVLTLTTKPNVVIVPSEAIQTGQQGQYLFVVKSDLTVESRPISVGITFNNETVIEKGLNIGETVVTDGQLRLYPGAKVEMKGSNLPPATKEKVK